MALAVADLRPAQRFRPRHLLLRTFCQVTTWEQANHMFQAEGRRLLKIADALPRKPLGRKVLIQPLWGIDDVSRDWSFEMVLEHLIVAGSAWAETLIQLSNGERPWHPALMLCSAETRANKRTSRKAILECGGLPPLWPRQEP
jgi:hypothetical protein